MYAVGSRYEDAATGGISHFAEHLFFKGTERRPTARHIATEIDGIGAEFNAFTGKEYTGYYVKCAKEHVPIAIDVLGDMLLHSLFDPEEIEREKGVIVEEMNMYIDTPTSYLPSVYDKLCYGDTRARPRHHRHARDGARGHARDVHQPPRPLVRAVAHRDRPRWRGHRRGAQRARRAVRLAAGRREPGSGAVDAAAPSARPHPPQGVGLVPHPHRRRRAAAAASRPLCGVRARSRARRRHVVAPLHGGARAPRPGLLHRRPARAVRRGRIAVLAGRRRPQAGRRGRDDDRGRAAQDRHASASPTRS